MSVFSTTPIIGLHPNLTREYTPRDCYEMSTMTGVGQQIVAGVLTGRIRPDVDICSRLDPFLGEGTIEMLRDNYDPFRGMEFVNNEDMEWMRYRLEERYPVSLLKKGDCIKTTNNMWIKVSRAKNTPRTVRIFSGGSLCTSTSNTNKVIVAVLISEADKDRDHQDLSLKEAQINKVRQAFQDHISDEDQQSRADLVYHMLNAARAEKRAEEL